MIVVKEKKEVPHADVRCGNCGSLLQYGNADLHEDYDHSDGMTAVFQRYSRPYYFNCPVCGCKVNADWIVNKENNYDRQSTENSQ